MGRRLWCGLFVLVLGIGAAEAQQCDPNLFRLIRPGLSLALLADLGSEPCGSVNLTAPWGSFTCEALHENFSLSGQIGQGTDALGALYRFRARQATPEENNFPVCIQGQVFDIERLIDASSREVVAVVPARKSIDDPDCTGGFRDFRISVLNLTSDAVNGNLYVAIAVQTECGSISTPQTNQAWKISGLPNLLDIIPTFTPASESLSWVTPKHPEALPAADRFMVYAGDVAALREDGDFTRAVPVDCDVPEVGTPSPGDFLSILDPLRAPSFGKVSYLVVGVEHQGNLRFGRQSMGGVLTGREPAVFPSCT